MGGELMDVSLALCEVPSWEDGISQREGEEIASSDCVVEVLYSGTTFLQMTCDTNAECP